MPDNDGYPTEEELAVIEKWDKFNVESFEELFEIIKDLWNWGPTYAIKHDQCHYELHTGGWSGNEDIIGAMKKNPVLWLLSCEWERRGGHYYFDLSLMPGGCRGKENEFWKFEITSQKGGD